MRRFIALLALLGIAGYCAALVWAAAEAGHAPNRIYTAQDGSFHLNGAAFYNDAEVDISANLELLSTTGTEATFTNGVVAATFSGTSITVTTATATTLTASASTLTTSTLGTATVTSLIATGGTFTTVTLGSTTITATAAELSQTNLLPTTASTITLSAGSAVTQSATITLKDADGNALTGVRPVMVYVADDSAGATPATDAVQVGVTATTGAIVTELTEALHFYCVTDANGVLVLLFDHTGGGAYAKYVVVALPQGVKVSAVTAMAGGG